MNTRIKELAQQAYQQSRSSPGLFEQKFAELIVREIMAMSDELKSQYLISRKSTMDFDEKNTFMQGEAACDVLKYKIKEHFGVK